MKASLRGLLLVLASLAGAAQAQQAAWIHTQRGSAVVESLTGCNMRPFVATKHAAVAANGDLVVAGCIAPYPNDEIVTARFDGATGNVLWTATFAGSGNRDDAASSVTIDAAGDVIVAGRSNESGRGDEMRIVKYHGTTGARLWTTAHGTTGDDLAMAVTTGPGNHVFVTGQVKTSSSDIRTLKLDAATGDVLWTATYSGTFGASTDKGQAIVVDAAGDAYVTGSSGETIGGTQWRVIKYAGATGNELWTAQHGVDGDDSGLDAAIDPAGNLVVGGYSYSNVTGGDYRVIKYASATGAELWNVGVSGLAPGGDQPTAIALDASGNVFITGDSYDADVGDNRRNMRTIKLAAANGGVLWNVIEDNGVGDDTGQAIAVDASGDAFVTGRVTATGPAGVMRTIKYRGTDGARLWAEDHAGTSLQPTSGSAVKVDGAGNVLAVGNRLDIRVIKYSGANGAQAWLSTLPAVRVQAVLPGGRYSMAQRGGLVATVSESPVGFTSTSNITVVDAATGLTVWTATSANRLTHVVIDPTGGVVVAGQSLADMQMHAARYDASGVLKWAITGSPGFFQSGASQALVLDNAGNAIVSGAVCTITTGACRPNLYTFKLDRVTGAQAWVYIAPNKSSPSLAIDSQDNVMLAARFDDPAGGVFSVTTRLGAANGSVLWTASKPNANTFPVTLAATDTDGNALVAVGGYGIIGFGTPALSLVKYAAANGAVLWDSAYPGGTSLNDIARAGDDVVIAAADATPSTVYWRTLRFSGANGGLAWNRERAVGTTDPGLPYPTTAVAVDPSGNVLVAGTEPIIGSRQTRAVATMLHGITGAPLWGLPISGAAQAHATADAVAIDDSGKIYVASTFMDAGLPFHVQVVKIDGGPTKPPAPSVSDLDSDMRSDFVLENTDGRIAVWTMNGTASTTTANLIGAGAGWTVTHIADLDADGKGDIFFKHTDGRVYVYRMNGVSVIGGKELLGAGLGWSVSHTADLDGDGKADLILKHTDGRAHLWLMNGTNVIGSASLLPAASGWHVVGTGDLNGDGKADIVFMHDDGRGYVYLMNGTTIIGSVGFLSPGSGWTVSHIADMNGDGKSDLVFRHTDGSAYLFLMNGTTFGAGVSLLGPGTGWSVTHTGDLNGDGKDDLVFKHTDGRAHVRLMNGTAILSAADVLPAASGWSVTHLYDLNGDGKKDLVFRHTDGRITVRLMDGLSTLGSANVLGAGNWFVAPASP